MHLIQLLSMSHGMFSYYQTCLILFAIYTEEQIKCVSDVI